MSSEPYMCSIKRVIEDDLGSPLYLGGMTIRHIKYSGNDEETFLLAENLI